MVTPAAVALVVALATQNVQQGLPPAAARYDIGRAAAGSSVVLTQEMGLRRAAAFAPPGWRVAHKNGLRRGDCATYSDAALWRPGATWTRQLTYARFRAGHRFALVTILHGLGRYAGTTLATVCVHLITRPRERPAVERAGVARLAALLAALETRHAHVIVGGTGMSGTAYAGQGSPPRP